MVSSLTATDISWLDMGVMLGVLIIITPMMWIGGRLSRLEGGILLALYLSYTVARFLLDKGMTNV
jgi:Ca2+/Na+ antiporter